MKVAFFDRDGTIVHDYPDEQWKDRTDPEFYEDSFDSMRKIRQKGYDIIIITNQYIINEGIITIDDYKKFTENLLTILRENEIVVMDIFFCPHARWENCECCKPRPGMINKALKKYPLIDLSESFMVGDSISDMKLAEKFDLKFWGLNMDSSLCSNTIHSLGEILPFIK